MGGVIWGLDASSAGRPGYLLRATATGPQLKEVAKVGTYASGLAVTAGRVWVVNGTGDPRDRAYKDSTVDEFDASGRLLHEYPVAGAVSIAARGSRAWVNVPGSRGTAIDELSAGHIKLVTMIGETLEAQAPMVGVLAHGQLAAVTSGTGRLTRVWFIDLVTGRHVATTSVPLSGLPSLAIAGSAVLVSVTSVASGGVARVTPRAAHLIPGCENPSSVAASTVGSWVLSTTDSGAPRVARVTAARCGPWETLSGTGATAQIAADGQTAWVLSATGLVDVR